MDTDSPDPLARYLDLRGRLLDLVANGQWASDDYLRLNEEALAVWDSLDAGQQADAEGRLLLESELTGGTVPDDEAAKWKRVDG